MNNQTRTELRKRKQKINDTESFFQKKKKPMRQMKYKKKMNVGIMQKQKKRWK